MLELLHDTKLHVPGISHGIPNVFPRSFLDDGEINVLLEASSGKKLPASVQAFEVDRDDLPT